MTTKEKELKKVKKVATHKVPFLTVAKALSAHFTKIDYRLLAVCWWGDEPGLVLYKAHGSFHVELFEYLDNGEFDWGGGEQYDTWSEALERFEKMIAIEYVVNE